MFGNKPSRRDIRMARKSSLDKAKADNYLKQLQDSYQPNAWKGYLDTITNIGKFAPNPFIKGISYATDFATDFIDRPRYDTSNAPKLEYGDNIIREANKKATLMNQLLKEKMWTDAIKTAAEFGFKDVPVKDKETGKMVSKGQSLFDMLLEKFKLQRTQ
tara:strand:- start:48 stop:524 length:477 start_codon:yes stop_codon:yes gene_type:complete